MDATRWRDAVGRWAGAVGVWACLVSAGGCYWPRVDTQRYRIEPRFVSGEHVYVRLRADVRATVEGDSPAGRVSERRELQYVERYQDHVLAVRDGQPVSVVRHWILAERTAKDPKQVAIQRRPWQGLTLKGVRRAGSDAYELFEVSADGSAAAWVPTDASLTGKVSDRLRDDLDMAYFAPEKPMRVGQTWSARAPRFMTRDRVPVGSASGTLREYVRPVCRLERASGTLLTLSMVADGRVPARASQASVSYGMKATLKYDTISQAVTEFRGEMRIWVQTEGQPRAASTVRNESCATYHIQYRRTAPTTQPARRARRRL